MLFRSTPKLDVNIELSDDYQDGAGKGGYTYSVNNINFGVEERPMTQLTLDKQIEEIILTTSDGNNIMDAKYNINYTVRDDGTIEANVELDTNNSYGIDNLQAINRDSATNRGYRYINVDSKILEGTTITVKYKFTVLNTGEVDRTGKLADMLYQDDGQIGGLRDTLITEFATFMKKQDNTLENTKPFGEYLGNIYYYGKDDAGTDKVVTSRVRQVVDYLDNDVEFSGTQNASKDMSWSSVTIDELKSHIDNGIVDATTGKVLDSDGVSYENMLMSVDNSTDGDGSTESTLNNGGFIVNLQPYAAGQTNYEASMYLTTTKFVGSDSDDLKIDNIAEIVRYNNKVGRRDELTIAGNTNPAEALPTGTARDKNPFDADGTLSAGMKYQRDTAATEVITLSPPFGSELMIWKLQVIASITVGLGIIAGGIVLIKKKVLK